MRALLALVLLASPLALAGPARVITGSETEGLTPQAAAVDINGWSLMDYSEHVLGINIQAVRTIIDAQEVAVAAGTPEAYEAWLKHAHAACVDAIARIEATPGWEGDTSITEEVAKNWRWLQGKLEGDFPEMFALLFKEDVTNADLERVEAITRTMDAETAALVARADQLQRDFAKRHKAVLIESSEEAALTDEIEEMTTSTFSHPGLPPEGSVLEPEIHVSFATRYHNQLVARQVAMMDALNGFIDATQAGGDAVEDARVAALKAVQAEVKAAKRAEDWQGDAGLREGLVAFGEELEGVLEGHFAEYTARVGKKRLSAKDADLANEHAAAADEAISEALQGFGQAQTAFQERWGMLAFEAWVRENEGM
ncbi:MAG: hypothetical protein H6739_11590 [Alphaproteobacteria bacterium]|nr:hypothetical protein [Alphaproteobacteria bacterium]